MKRNHDIESLMLTVLYGEASDAERKELDQCLAQDPVRKREYHELEQTLEAVDTNLNISDPGEEFWDQTWNRFQDRLAAAEQDTEVHVEKRRAWYLFWKPAMQIGFVATMLVLGVFIGKQFTGGAGIQEPSIADQRNSSLVEEPLMQEAVREKQNYMTTVARDSLARSDRMLDRFMQIDTGAGYETRKPDWIVESRDEVMELMNIFTALRNYQQDDSSREITPLLDELEILLGEIASIPSESEEDLRFEIRMLQQGIERRNLLERIRQVMPAKSVNGLR